MDEKLGGSGCIGTPLLLSNETVTIDMQLLEFSCLWIELTSFLGCMIFAASGLTFLPGHFLAGLLLIAS
jgi:hypothetical protein